MGKDKKKQLTQLLAFVKDLYEHPDNKEFAAGIQEMVLADDDFWKRRRSSASDGMVGPDEDIRQIKEYLSLDFGIDQEDLEDYDFVSDKKVRLQLLTDYREMLRYQFGTRNHRVDFLEFCRFAHLQVEMLVNYYFEIAFDGNFGMMIDALKENYGEFKVAEKASNISEVFFKSKLFYLMSVFGWTRKDISVYLNVYEVRNRQSHRSLRNDKDLIEEVGKLLRNPSFKRADGTVDYSKATASIGQERINEYWFQVWYDRLPFEEVTGNLRKLSEAIQNTL